MFSRDRYIIVDTHTQLWICYGRRGLRALATGSLLLCFCSGTTVAVLISSAWAWPPSRLHAQLQSMPLKNPNVCVYIYIYRQLWKQKLSDSHINLWQFIYIALNLTWLHDVTWSPINIIKSCICMNLCVIYINTCMAGITFFFWNVTSVMHPKVRTCCNHIWPSNFQLDATVLINN